MQMKTHDPDAIFAPVGPYTHGLEWWRRAGYCSSPALAWRNIGAILEQAGMSMRNLAKVTCYLAERKYREANMHARAAALGDHRLATTVIAAALLEDGWLVEIEAIAVA